MVKIALTSFNAQCLVRSNTLKSFDTNNISAFCPLCAKNFSKTSVCPLAKVIRTELRKRRIKGVKVVYSKELPIKPKEDMSISCKSHCVCPPGTRKCTVKHQIPGSNAFVPPVVGLIIAGEVIKDLIGYKK